MHPPCWEPGTSYGYDDVVEYEGTFKTTVTTQVGLQEDQVIDIRSSSHIAPRLDPLLLSKFVSHLLDDKSDWTPPITPALWGRLSDHDSNYGGESDCNKQQQPYHDQQQQQQQQHHQGQYDQQSQGTSFKTWIVFQCRLVDNIFFRPS